MVLRDAEQRLEDTNIWVKNLELPLKLTGQNRGERPTVLLTEDDGTLRAWSLVIGRGPDGEDRHILTDDAGFQRNRPFEPYETVAFDVVTTGFGTVYTVPAGVIAKVWFTITNVTVNEVAVSLAIGGATVLPFGATPRVPLAPDGPGISGGPYILAVAEIVQHRCDTVNGAHIRVEVEEYGLGDAP